MFLDRSLTHKIPSIRYGPCWEDADILIEGLSVQPGQSCLSIGSAGDNTLALLGNAPERVIVVDYDPVQLACLQLRIAAFRVLEYEQMLELLGVVPSLRREGLYKRCRTALSTDALRYWDQHLNLIAIGIINVGRLERYLSLFHSRVMPFVHPPARVSQLFELKDEDQRRRFFVKEWDTWRWRTIFQLFFSRWFMARSGRDPSCFRHVSGSVSRNLLRRSEHALITLEPAQNPYLRWILTGRHGEVLPYAWRREHFDSIRAHLDCITLRCAPLDQVLDELDKASIDNFNLSDVFEYLTLAHYHKLIFRIATVARQRARIAYWNLFVDRQRPGELAEHIRPLDVLADRLHRRDKTFFYKRFVLEEVRC